MSETQEVPPTGMALGREGFPTSRALMCTPIRFSQGHARRGGQASCQLPAPPTPSPPRRGCQGLRARSAGQCGLGRCPAHRGARCVVQWLGAGPSEERGAVSLPHPGPAQPGFHGLPPLSPPQLAGSGGDEPSEEVADQACPRWWHQRWVPPGWSGLPRRPCRAPGYHTSCSKCGRVTGLACPPRIFISPWAPAHRSPPPRRLLTVQDRPPTVRGHCCLLWLRGP